MNKLLILLITINVFGDSPSGEHHLPALIKSATNLTSPNPGEDCHEDIDEVDTTVQENVNLPPLLTDKFYAPKEVCQDAKKRNAKDGVNKRFAMILKKGHLCDRRLKWCLSSLTTMMDPCNKFVKENFQTYHTMAFKEKRNGSSYENVPAVGNEGIQSTYGEVGPIIRVIDLKTCKLLPRMAQVGYIFENGKLTSRYKNSKTNQKRSVAIHPDQKMRIQSMTNALLTFKQVRESLDDYSKYFNEDNSISKKSVCSDKKNSLLDPDKLKILSKQVKNQYFQQTGDKSD